MEYCEWKTRWDGPCCLLLDTCVTALHQCLFKKDLDAETRLDMLQLKLNLFLKTYLYVYAVFYRESLIFFLYKKFKFISSSHYYV